MRDEVVEAIWFETRLPSEFVMVFVPDIEDAGRGKRFMGEELTDVVVGWVSMVVVGRGLVGDFSRDT